MTPQTTPLDPKTRARILNMRGTGHRLRGLGEQNGWDDRLSSNESTREGLGRGGRRRTSRQEAPRSRPLQQGNGAVGA